MKNIKYEKSFLQQEIFMEITVYGNGCMQKTLYIESTVYKILLMMKYKVKLIYDK